MLIKKISQIKEIDNPNNNENFDTKFEKSIFMPIFYLGNNSINNQ